MLSDQELDHIAGLARLHIEPKDREALKKDLSSILNYVEKLNQANTDNVEPLYQTTGLINSIREDELRNEFPPSEKLDRLLVGQAPQKKDRFVKVRSILTKK